MQSDGDVELPEYTRQSRCKVCSAPDRDVPNGTILRNLVDELLLVPKSYAAILRIVEPLMESWPQESRISKFSVMRHGQRHLEWEQRAVRQIAERRAKDAGRVDEASGRMLTAATVYEVVQQRGFDRVLAGGLNPTVRDMLNATEALRQIEQEAEGQFSTVEMLSQLNRIIEVIREYVPESLWPQLLDRIDDASPTSPPRADSIWEEIAGEVGDRPGRASEVQRTATTRE